MFTIYSLFYTLGFILMIPAFIFRRDKYLPGLRERFGRVPEFERSGSPLIWIHCVSVGETNAARPLVARIREEFPTHRIVISTVTRTGQDLAKSVFAGTADLVFYFPFDWAFTVRRTLRQIRPDLILMVETEIWFNFFREVRRRGITLAIVNGRLSEKSLKGYLRIPKTIKRVVRCADHVLVQTSADARRFHSIGTPKKKIVVTGNIKHDQEAESRRNDRVAYFRERFEIREDEPLIVAASTHPPEEELILESFLNLRTRAGFERTRLVIAPRHPERFASVAELLNETGLAWARRSGSLGIEDGEADIILLDSIGELRSLYPLADLVFVGGSLVPHGGQNILEPALEKKAIITGPHMQNFQAIVDDFEKAGAMIMLPEADTSEYAKALESEFCRLLGDGSFRDEMGTKAWETATASRGAVEKTLHVLAPLLNVQSRSRDAVSTSSSR